MAPRFVVAQVGRTGSGYTAQVLTAAGIRTGHEAWWNPHGVREPWIVGDSSWCAVPFLPGFDGITFHQVREPLATLRSLIDEGIGTDWDTPYTRLRHNIIGGPSGNPLLDVIKVWVTMNDAIEPFARKRFKVEDFDASLVVEIGRSIGLTISPQKAAEAIDSVPNTYNKHHIPDEFGWDALPRGEWFDRLVEMSTEYGYDLDL